MTPAPEQVKQVREVVQAGSNLGITAAQDWCAAALHTSRRSFQQWETGARAMHPAFWELLTIKNELIAPTVSTGTKVNRLKLCEYTKSELGKADKKCEGCKHKGAA